MSSPGSQARPGFFMVFSVADFMGPRRESQDEPEVFIEEIPDREVQERPVSAGYPVYQPQEPAPERPESFRRQKEFMDHEYPEWVDEVPPWRNPDAKGETYLYVWQQHQARIRGHH